MNTVRWGILSTAKIAREKVIPAMQAAMHCDVVAIASSNTTLVQEIAAQLKIPVVHHSYEALLNDPNVDAVYIPLPNHLHVEWAIKALQAGKHVLCEKPIAMSVAQANELLKAAQQYPQLKIMEAFMYRFHPQWTTTQNLIAAGRIGTLKTVQSFFSYYNADPNNIRNKVETGGGGMMDIGCYCVSLSRFLFSAEPVRVMGYVEKDPALQTDTLASGILDFGKGRSATFTCSTQLMPYQRVNILGTDGRIEIDIPFNAPPTEITRMRLYNKIGVEEFNFQPINQYTLQGDLFSISVLKNEPVPTPLTDAVANMKVIEEILRNS